MAPTPHYGQYLLELLKVAADPFECLLRSWPFASSCSSPRGPPGKFECSSVRPPSCTDKVMVLSAWRLQTRLSASSVGGLPQAPALLPEALPANSSAYGYGPHPARTRSWCSPKVAADPFECLLSWWPSASPCSIPGGPPSLRECVPGLPLPHTTDKIFRISARWLQTRLSASSAPGLSQAPALLPEALPAYSSVCGYAPHPSRTRSWCSPQGGC